MSTTTPEAPAVSSSTATCPPWCDAFHVEPPVEDHIRLVGSVHRKPHLESIAIEIEQAPNAPHPRIVLSLFTTKKNPKAMSAGLTIEDARQAHAALGDALRLLGYVTTA